MSVNKNKWGCCGEGNDGDKFLACSQCSEKYHLSCVGADEKFYTPKRQAAWTCPTCVSSLPRKGIDDNTPIRNTSTSRVNKRPATNSPPEIRNLDTLTREDITDIVQSAIDIKLDAIVSQLHSVLITALNEKLQPIRSEMSDMIKSMELMNVRFEEDCLEHKQTKESMQALKNENDSLKSTVSELSSRISQLEQHSRAKNIEIQCVPEKNHENLINIVTMIGKVVNCNIKNEQILTCTRVTKLQKNTNRPRSIIVELATPRLRDEMLAAVIKYNKANSADKLNSAVIGIPGVKSQIYVAEHLSPANKTLHAAARIKAKQMNYKFVWVRNGRIFTRKDEESGYIWIKDSSSLDKII